MFPTYNFKSTLSLSKILGGLSKTLSIANQVIPLYKQVAPTIHTAKTLLKKIKLPTNNPRITSQNKQTTLSSPTSKPKQSPINQPVFFE